MTDPNQWQYEQNCALAERAHDNETDFCTSANEAAVDTGNNALKSLVLVNGGAAIAMLAFIGHLISADKNRFDSLVDLAAPLSWFAWGVACAAGSMALGYLANFSMGKESTLKKRSYDYPYLSETEASKRWATAISVFQVLAVGAGFASLVLFVYGILEVRDVISAIPAAPVSPVVTPK